MAPRIITVAIEKGGIGKTTTVVNLAHLFAADNKKVLVIDCDPQANATLTLTGVNKQDWSHKGIFDLIRAFEVPGADMDYFVQPTKIDKIDIIPSNLNTKQILTLLKINAETHGAVTYRILGAAIEPIVQGYDIVLIDTPPSQDDLTVSALYACTDVIIPIVADKYSREGLINTMALIEELEQKEQKKITLLGILFVKTERTVIQDIHREQITESEFNDLLFQSEIRKGQPVVESIELNEAVVVKFPKSKPASDYRKFYAELKQRMGG